MTQTTQNETAPTPQPETPPATATIKPQHPWLTALRFFAALYVVVFHVWGRGVVDGSGAVDNIVVGGPVAVSFFFVLSGFVLTITHIDGAGALTTTKGKFWRARFARVAPLYWLSLVIALPIALAIWKRDGADPFAFRVLVHDGILAFLALQSWIPRAALALNPAAWSLCVEVFFYGAFVVVAPALARRASRPLFALLWLLSLAPCVAYVVLRPDGVDVDPTTRGFFIDALKYHPLLRFPELCMGVVAGKFFVDGGRVDVKFSFAAVFVQAGALALGLPYALQHNGLFAPLFAILLLGCASTTSSPPRFLVMLGHSSYALYLLHLPLLFWISGIGERRTGRKILEDADVKVAAVACCVVVSVVVYKVFEDPIRRRLR